MLAALGASTMLASECSTIAACIHRSPVCLPRACLPRRGTSDNPEDLLKSDLGRQEPVADPILHATGQ